MDVSKLNAAIRDIRMPMRMARLPINERGYPVPYFVSASGDFRVADPEKFKACIDKKLCWLCGDKLGQYLVFVIGPMCAVNRVTSEPPCHLECAQYAALVCPFLSHPNMRRNEVDPPPEDIMPGIALLHNPGAAALWITKGYKIRRDDKGMVLFDIGEPTNVFWYRKGRPATRGEVLESMYGGLPSLERYAYTPKAKEALMVAVAEALRYLPQEEDEHARPVRHGEPDREGVRCSEQSAADERPADAG